MTLNYLKQYDFEQHSLTGNWSWSEGLGYAKKNHFYKEIYLYPNDEEVEFVFYLDCGFDDETGFFFGEEKFELEKIPDNVDIYDEDEFISWLNEKLREHSLKYEK